MEKKYILIFGALLIAGGLGYYYYDDISNMIEYKKKEDHIKEYASKKIKSKPVDIKIENLNEL